MCACECGLELPPGMRPSARYINAAHKTTAWRNRRRQTAAVTSQTARQRQDKTGVRVGYARVVAELKQLPVSNGLVVTTPANLERAVWKALPDRQRQRLQQRQEAA